MSEEKSQYIFRKDNSKLIIGGLIAVVIGFALMSGGGTENPAEFSEEVFSFRRITLAPIVILAGYFALGLGIMRKPKA
jgi:hypothetical protein